jgi:hypothetical protein
VRIEKGTQFYFTIIDFQWALLLILLLYFFAMMLLLIWPVKRTERWKKWVNKVVMQWKCFHKSLFSASQHFPHFRSIFRHTRHWKLAC